MDQSTALPDTRSPDTDVAQVFRAAKDMLTQRGWRQGMRMPGQSGVCVGEAIADTYQLFHSSDNYANIPYGISELCMTFVVANELPPWCQVATAIGTVVHWNDAAGRTRNEVFAALDKAAQYAATTKEDV